MTRKSGLILAAIAGVLWLTWELGSHFGGGNHASQSEHAMHKLAYHCAMHPQIRSAEPGQCPICHMQLVPDDPKAEVDPNEHAGHEVVAGRVAFKLAPERQEIIGVSTEEVKKAALTDEIRAGARVAYDPELYTAIREYQLTLRSRGGELSGESKDTQLRTSSLTNAAHVKLRLLGLSESNIERLEKAKDAPPELLLPQGSAWLYAEIFDYEVSDVHEGQTIIAVAPALSGREFHGKVTSVSALLGRESRTIRVIAEVDDPGRLLKPETYLTVRIQIDLGERLSVPGDSLVLSGERALCFVKVGDDLFEPRLVEIGRAVADRYEILSGVQEGDAVVRSANFLIDSESRMQAILASGAGGAGGHSHH